MDAEKVNKIEGKLWREKRERLVLVGYGNAGRHSRENYKNYSMQQIRKM